MKKRLWKIIFAILMLPVYASAYDFYEDGWITDGNVFDTVNVWDDANVIMTGGWAFYCNLYDSSAFDFYDGDVGLFSAYGSAIVNVFASDNPGFDIYNQSQVHLFNGCDGSSVFIYDDAELHIYGYNLEYEESAAPNWVTGQWESGQEFWIILRNVYTYNPEQVFLHEIPEPSTLSLLGLLVLLVRKRGN